MTLDEIVDWIANHDLSVQLGIIGLIMIFCCAIIVAGEFERKKK